MQMLKNLNKLLTVKMLAWRFTEFKKIILCFMFHSCVSLAPITYFLLSAYISHYCSVRNEKVDECSIVDIFTELC